MASPSLFSLQISPATPKLCSKAPKAQLIVIFPILTPAQGKSYLMLRQLDEWLDGVQTAANNQGLKVQGILVEAHQFLTS
jgi:hypothetical protein